MNQEWHTFLTNRGASVNENDTALFPAEKDWPSLYKLTHLGALSVSGEDSETFLQGQATCDVSKITPYRSSLGAFCNPKGRVATTFTLVKKSDATFLLLLPMELLAPVQQRLQRYVLRADVTLEDVTSHWCHIGISGQRLAPIWAQQNIRLRDEINETRISADQIIIRIHAASERFLVLASPAKAMKLWTYLADSAGFSERSSALWMCQDIFDGIPLITTATSEAFIPQMINLDLLGGISFEKGCYTGQEVVARMHYLGTLKRRMYLMSCTGRHLPNPGDPVYDTHAGDEQQTGTVVMATLRTPDEIYLLAVLQVASAQSTALRIHTADGEVLTRRPLPYHWEAE